MTEKIVITIFTDPMMGLSYESEPLFRKLETHFMGNIEFQYKMGFLVRNVYDFVNPQDMKKGKDYAIKKYNERLAGIYEKEEAISGMPINMNGFKLFDTEHISSLNLNLAYKAAEIISPQKAALFLYNLRYSTIVLCRPTTHLEEIMKVVNYTGIDAEKFRNCYNGQNVKTALEQDLYIAKELQIYTLPAYIVQYKGNTVIIRNMIDYNAFVKVIDEITEGKLKPKEAKPSVEKIKNLLEKHPLISPIEIYEAFDFKNIDDVKEFLNPVLKSGFAEIKNVYHGQFIEKKRSFENEKYI